MIERVHHIGVVVADLRAAEAFATRVLGLNVMRRVSLPAESTEIVFLKCGTVQIELIEVSDPRRRSQRMPSAEMTAAIEHIAVEVGDLDTDAARLSEAGVRFTAGAGKLEQTTEPLVVAGTRSLFSVPSTSSGVTWQLIEEL